MTEPTTYHYIDGPVTATFDGPHTIRPEEAAAWLGSVIEAAGGYVAQGFSPEEQQRNAGPGFVSADILVALPDGRKVWVNVECPTDDLEGTVAYA